MPLRVHCCSHGTLYAVSASQSFTAARVERLASELSALGRFQGMTQSYTGRGTKNLGCGRVLDHVEAVVNG